MSSRAQMYTVDKFLGLNQAADGETELKMGQSPKMENFQITDGYNLALRPGIRRVDADNRDGGNILASWSGVVGSKEYLIIVDILNREDRIWIYTMEDDQSFVLEHVQKGALDIASEQGAKVKVFTFAGTVYIMSAGNILSMQNGIFGIADIYIPLVVIGASPSGGGTTLENLNLLSGLRRIQFSADGESTKFVLPEEAVGVTSLVIDNVTYAVETAGDFDALTHSYTFHSAPAKGVSNVEFTYDTDHGDASRNRMRVINMTLTETYNGSTDTRLFLAGDGSNICLYSGVPQSGDLTKLYFPAMNEVAVDMSASPITGLVRHYSKLLVFKTDGTYTITYEPVTLTDGNTIAGFYLRSANREFGNEIMGQVQTVENYPRTISGGGIYEWRITSSYYQDERYAKRISEPVDRSLLKANLQNAVTCDDNRDKTYYIFLNDSEGTVLVNRYSLNGNIWFMYKSVLFRNVRHAMAVSGTVIFTTDTDAYYLAPGITWDVSKEKERNDVPIPAVWESGYMDFGADFKRKYSSLIYVSMLPEARSSVTITASTDRREKYREKVIGSTLFSFANMDFSNFSFDTNYSPKIRRVRLKVKKFVYYKLIFRVEDPGASATILSYDQQVRFSSMVK